MPEFDLISTVIQSSPVLGLALVMYYQMRRDYADALRREQQFSVQLAATIERYLQLQEKTIESVTKLERQNHELKNTIQRLIYAIERAFPSSNLRGKESGSND